MAVLRRDIESAICIAALLCLGGNPAWASSIFESGLKYYGHGRYERAVIYFTLAAEEDPHNALVHYYLADTLARSGHHEEAIVEYGLCYRLSPTGQMSAYCKQALAGYDRALPAKQTRRNGTAANAGRFDGSGPLIGTSDEEELVARTKSHIREEVIYEKAKHKQLGEFNAASAMTRAAQEAKLIQEEAARDIDDATRPQYLMVGRIVRLVAPDPEVARVKVEEIKRIAAERTETSQKSAQEKADRYKEWSQERQNSLDEVVANLEDQLEQPVGNSGVKLQPVGTDLYTRYYGSSTASANTPEVRPPSVRVVTHPNGLKGNAESLPAIHPASGNLRVQKVVRGTLLH